MSAEAADRYADWIGRTETVTDVIDAGKAAAMAATLNREPAPWRDGDALPPLWHWLFFLDTPRTDALAADGHLERGRFLPPIEDLPRRMWAGSRIRFHQPLRIGERAERVSRIADVVEKQGRSGRLAIVTVEHRITGAGGLAITDEHDIVYREPPSGEAAGAAASAPGPDAEPEWSREWVADPVLLFRYSALTFNSHRIHYDHPYATRVEGYPGLIVHGPLVPTLMLEEWARRHPDSAIAHIDIRALRPLFHGTPFRVEGRRTEAGAEMWSVDEHGALTLRAQAELDDDH